MHDTGELPPERADQRAAPPGDAVAAEDAALAEDAAPAGDTVPAEDAALAGDAVPAGDTAERPAPVSLAAPQAPFTDRLDREAVLWSRSRRRFIRLVIVISLVTPFLSRPWPGTTKIVFLGAATAVFIVITDRLLVRPQPVIPRRIPWEWLAVELGIALAILAVGGWNWIDALVVAGAAAGRFAPTPRAAVVGTACCIAAGLGVGLIHGLTYANGLVTIVLTSLASLFAYNASRRGELVLKLQETRAELARMAVADERLRIARDLHDLLGHSLSLITLKAELAGRVIGTDPDRAAGEIADLEAVARRSLGEVRAAVTSYRQPTLAAELAEARQMLAAAGMRCEVHAPASVDVAPEAEALLAWTVREGATNVVRHSGARTVTITITAAADEVTAEVTDDGVGPGWGPGPDSGPPGPGGPGSGARGSGLTGLTERARRVGARVDAGEGRGGKGFRLLVRVPAG